MNPSNPKHPLTPHQLFRHNLANLKPHDPHLHHLLSTQSYPHLYRISDSVDPKQPFVIQKAHPSAPERGSDGRIHPAAPIQTANALLESLPWREHDLLFVINTGLGYTARVLGERFFLESFQTKRKRKLIFVEEDAALFRLSLHLQNWDVNLWQPQVMWMVGTPIAALLEHTLFKDCPNLFLHNPLWIPGGIFSNRESDELEHIKRQWKTCKEKQIRQVAHGFSTIHARTHRFSTTGSKRVLFLNADRHPDLQKSIAWIFQQWGWSCRRVAPKSHPRYGHHLYGMYQEWTWLDALSAFDADMIFLLNHIPPESGWPETLSRLDIPVVTWYVDDPQRDRDLIDRCGDDTARCLLFCYDPAHTGYLQQRGYEQVFHLPVGTVVDPHRVKRHGFKMHTGTGYVGSLMTGEAILNQRVLSENYPQWHDWLRRSMQEIQSGVWKDETDCMRRKPLPMDEPLDEAVAITYLQDAITNQTRMDALETQTQFHLKTYGNRDLISDRCSDTLKQAYQGRRIAYHEELPALYAQTAVNLNLNHFQTKEGIALRILDCLAAGGFILTDNNPAIEQAFVNHQEVVYYAHSEEMVDVTRYYLQHPQQRERIIQAGQTKVLERHRLEDRLREMMKHIEESEM